MNVIGDFKTETHKYTTHTSHLNGAEQENGIRDLRALDELPTTGYLLGKKTKKKKEDYFNTSQSENYSNTSSPRSKHKNMEQG